MWNIVVFVFGVVCLGKAIADNKLIVVLIDGMRWDYIDDPKLKGIRRIIENGVRASYVIPVYPSLSYPNYQTIATGLYPENHGFVANLMYDNETDTDFKMIPHPGSTDPHWWNEAEPVWITAEKRGRPSAVYWWAGCEVEIMQHHPTICERQRFGPPAPEETLDFLERIDDVVEMFKPSRRFPNDRLSLALFYYGGVDYAGHAAGPTSPEVKVALYDIDNILDQMQSKLKRAGLQDQVNIMVVADHGMTEVNDKVIKYVSLERFASKIKFHVDSGAQTMILPMPGMTDQLYDQMKNANLEGVRVFKKEEIPDYYHIKKSNRTLPIYLVAKKGFMIQALKDESKRLGSGPHTTHGHHGFDPTEVEDMRTVFFATGPDFRKGFRSEALYTTDLYNIMCSVLNLDPLPNNGTLDRVKPMLLKYDSVGEEHLAGEAASSAAAAGIAKSCYYYVLCCCLVLLHRAVVLHTHL